MPAAEPNGQQPLRRTDAVIADRATHAVNIEAGEIWPGISSARSCAAGGSRRPPLAPRLLDRGVPGDVDAVLRGELDARH